jgi:glycosyltransferase involved in cell wall biosynthesis
MAFEKQIAFVSTVTRSHLPYARTMFESVRRFYPDMPMYLILVDKLEGDCSCGSGVEVIPAEDLLIHNFQEMVNRYTNTELCVALKPFAILEAIERQRNIIGGIVYFDADIYLISPMRELEDLASKDMDIVLTPHLTMPVGNGFPKELDLLRHGACNLGFIYCSTSDITINILRWWAEWLKTHCYEDLELGLYGDQKWSDLFQGFLDNFKILRHDGYNVAYWNIAFRDVRFNEDRWSVNNVPLRFIHFSLLEMEGSYRLTPWDDQCLIPKNLGDLPLLMKEYVSRVHMHGYSDYKGLPCLLRSIPLARKDPRIGGQDYEKPQPAVRPFTGFLRTGFISRLARGLLLLPALVYFPLAGAMRGVEAWAGRFFKPALEVPSMVFGMFRADHNALVGKLVFPSYTFATGIGVYGGIVPCLKRLGQIGYATFKKEVASSVCDYVETSINAVLVTDTRIPHHDMIAADKVTFNIMRNLVELGYDVTFLSPDDSPQKHYILDLQRIGVNLDYKYEQHGSIENYLIKFGRNFAAIYLQPLWLAEKYLNMLRCYAPDTTIIFHAADLSFLRLLREAELKNNAQLRFQASKVKEREQKVITSVDHVVVVSEKEKEYLISEVDADIPVSLLTSLYADIVEAPPAYEERKDIIFVGVFGHPPNVDAVLWFAKKIWPHIHREIPDMVFHVVGNYPPLSITKLHGSDNIRIHGYVKDLAPLLASVRTAVAPLRYGAGIKGKVGLAMGAGVPNVCTTMAVEGMNVRDGEEALLADSVDDFAAAVIRLYSDPDLWRRVAMAGRRLAHERYGYESGLKQVATIMSEVGLRPNKGIA